MTLDFLSASLVLCISGFRVIRVETPIERVFAAEFLIGMAIQLTYFYWFANEVIFQVCWA